MIGVDRPEEIGGILAAGASAAGNRYALGRIRDMAADAGPLGSATVAFAFDGLTDGVRFLGLVDGVPRLPLAIGEPWEVEPLGEGSFDLEVLPLDAEHAADPFLAPDLIGNKSFLEWNAPATVTTLAGYRVYTGANVFLGEITTVDVASVDAGAPDVSGGWLLAQREQDLTLVVVADDGWELRRGSEVLASGTIIAGIPQATATGLVFEWGEGPYAPDDEWEIALAFRRYFIAPSGGTFKVTALDANGTETALNTAPTVTVNVIGLPDPPVVTGYTFNTGTRQASIAFTAVAGSFARLYTDIDVAAGIAAPHIEEDWYADRKATGPLVVTVPASMASFRCYVRREAANGRVERNARLLVFSALAAGLSATGAAVVIESTETGTGNTIVVNWSVDIQAGVPEGIEVYRSDTETGTQTLLDLLELTPGLADFPTYRRATILEFPAPGTYWIEFRAVYSDGDVRGVVTGPLSVLATGSSPVQNLLGWEN
jgi:hypothetical protein